MSLIRVYHLLATLIKTQTYEEQRVDIAALAANSSDYEGENVTVKGYIDIKIGLSDDTKYVVHPRFDRQTTIEFTDCKGDEDLDEQHYVIGTLIEVEKKTMYDRMNLTEEEKENIRTANRAMKAYGNGTPDNYKLDSNETKHIIDCERIVPVL